MPSCRRPAPRRRQSPRHAGRRRPCWHRGRPGRRRPGACSWAAPRLFFSISPAGTLRAWAMWPAWNCSIVRISTQTAWRWLIIWMASAVLTPPELPLRVAISSMTPDTTATARMKMLFWPIKNCTKSTEGPEISRFIRDFQSRNMALSPRSAPGPGRDVSGVQAGNYKMSANRGFFNLRF